MPTPPHLIGALPPGMTRAEAALLLSRVNGMSSAESEVWVQVIMARTDAEIALERGRALSTVKAQIRALLVKSGARSRVQLAVIGLECLWRWVLSCTSD